MEHYEESLEWGCCQSDCRDRKVKPRLLIGIFLPQVLMNECLVGLHGFGWPAACDQGKEVLSQSEHNVRIIAKAMYRLLCITMFEHQFVPSSFSGAFCLGLLHTSTMSLSSGWCLSANLGHPSSSS